jgi:D-mannonate dehydratase
MAEEKTPRDTKADTDKVFEELKVTGDNLLKTVRELIHEGNYRRIIIRNEHGHTLLEVPLTIGLVGALLMPVWAAIGAIGAMATGFTIIVERPGEEPKKPA